MQLTFTQIIPLLNLLIIVDVVKIQLRNGVYYPCTPQINYENDIYLQKMDKFLSEISFNNEIFTINNSNIYLQLPSVSGIVVQDNQVTMGVMNTGWTGIHSFDLSNTTHYNCFHFT